MAGKREKPEDIVTKLRQVEVLHGQGAQRNPARHSSLRPGILEAVDRIPRPQPRGGQDAMPERLR